MLFPAFYTIVLKVFSMQVQLVAVYKVKKKESDLPAAKSPSPIELRLCKTYVGHMKWPPVWWISLDCNFKAVLLGGWVGGGNMKHRKGE